MTLENSALVVIDVQEKLMPAMANDARLSARIQLMIKGSGLLKIPIIVTEQYPKGLGPTTPDVQLLLSNSNVIGRAEKTMFSVRAGAEAFDSLAQQGITNLVIVGIETHVCVAQSALDLLANGFEVFVCADAVGSRNTIDHETALRRMENSGVIPTTVEAVLFEWCENANHDSFKTISKSIK
jgi:nicotinamidase-related amidase